MEIQIAKQDLATAIQVVNIGVDNKDDTKLVAHYLFRVQDGVAEVLVSDNKLGISAPLTAATTDGDGMFTVVAKRFLKWLNATGDSVITLKSEGKGSIDASTPWGSVKFASLDPSKFQFWDDDLEAAKTQEEVSAERLKKIFSYLQPFVLNMEETYPDKSLTECVEGVFYATDLVAVTVARLRDGDDTRLAKSGMRVHVKHVPKVRDFLNQAGEENVEVLVNEKTGTFFKLPDGATFMAVRPEHSFPQINVSMDDVPPMGWTLPTKELSRAVDWLLAGALKYDVNNASSYLITFTWDGSDVKLSMRRYQGGGENTLSITPTDTRGLDDLPEGGFRIPYPYVQSMLKQFDSPEIEFGLTTKGKSKGWTTFSHTEGDDQFITMVGWK